MPTAPNQSQRMAVFPKQAHVQQAAIALRPDPPAGLHPLDSQPRLSPFGPTRPPVSTRSTINPA